MSPGSKDIYNGKVSPERNTFLQDKHCSQLGKRQQPGRADFGKSELKKKASIFKLLVLCCSH